MVSLAHARNTGSELRALRAPSLVAPRTIGDIRDSLPEDLRPTFDTEVRRTELPGLQGVLRFWRARAAARNDPKRLRALEEAREEHVWTAERG